MIENIKNKINVKLKTYNCVSKNIRFDIINVFLFLFEKTLYSEPNQDRNQELEDFFIYRMVTIQ